MDLVSNESSEVSSLTLEQANDILTESGSFFTENKGQWQEEILFMGSTDFGKVAFTSEAVYYQLVKDEPVLSQLDVPQESHPAKAISTRNISNGSIATQTIKLSFVNSESPKVQGKA
ncbi:MAG: hypothetical protein KAH01_05230, partial [Caldisericia bacterium]|nr:hypothetical protein [Caldisericia bacterium]